MIVEVLRIVTSLVWVVLIVMFMRPAFRVLRGRSKLKAVEAMMAATWLLAINREAFAAVAEFDPGDSDALALCYVFAFVAGLLMVGAGLWARRDAY